MKIHLLGLMAIGVIVITSAQYSSGIGEFVEIDNWGSFGILTPSEFSYPQFIDTDSDGNIYVTDLGNKRVQKFLSDGQFLAMWGTSGNSNGQFYHPSGIVVHNDTVFVVDRDLHRVQQFTLDGEFVTKWGERGSHNGDLLYPNDIAVYNGMLYVVDTGNQRIQVFWTNGTYIKSIGSSGLNMGEFLTISSIDIDSDGNLYVADQGNKKIEKFTSSGDLVSTFDFETRDYEFVPSSVLVDQKGMLLIVNSADDRILYVSQNSTSLNNVDQRGPFDDEYNTITDMTIGINGEIILVDSESHKIRSFTSPYYIAPPVVAISQNMTKTTHFDKTKPTITVPGPITVEATDKLTEVHLGEANATDSSGIRGITNTAPKFFTPGTTIVKWIAFDNEGYTSSANQAVTVMVCGKTIYDYNLIEGTPNDDLLIGTDKDDLIFGLGGNDIISGGLGNDCIFGGLGDDILSGNDGSDTIRGNDGNDIMQGQSGYDIIYGDPESDIIRSDLVDQCYVDGIDTPIDCN